MTTPPYGQSYIVRPPYSDFTTPSGMSYHNDGTYASPSTTIPNVPSPIFYFEPQTYPVPRSVPSPRLPQIWSPGSPIASTVSPIIPAIRLPQIGNFAAPKLPTVPTVTLPLSPIYSAPRGDTAIPAVSLPKIVLPPVSPRITGPLSPRITGPLSPRITGPLSPILSRPISTIPTSNAPAPLSPCLTRPMSPSINHPCPLSPQYYNGYSNAANSYNTSKVSNSNSYPIPASVLSPSVSAVYSPKARKTLSPMSSPISSMLSPSSRGRGHLQSSGALTPNSMMAVVQDYTRQWIPDNKNVEPMRGVLNVGTILQQQQNVTNGYQAVPLPYLSTVVMDYDDISIPLGYRDEERKQVATHMRSLAEITSHFGKRHRTKYLGLPDAPLIATVEQFNEYLLIYENNQVYYQEQLEEPQADQVILGAGLVALERWFAAIQEPEDIEGALEHRQFLAKRGVTAHCDPELYPFLQGLFKG